MELSKRMVMIMLRHLATSEGGQTVISLHRQLRQSSSERFQMTLDQLQSMLGQLLDARLVRAERRRNADNHLVLYYQVSQSGRELLVARTEKYLADKHLPKGVAHLKSEKEREIKLFDRSIMFLRMMGWEMGAPAMQELLERLREPLQKEN